jgi:murein DD-endopeptidase MepM/ murein hydrolase activator NlpD
MTTSKKLLITWIVSVALYTGLAGVGHTESLCKVVSPKRFEKLHSFPVNVVVVFSQEARPDTFKASLNGVDITDRFNDIANGVQAYIRFRDGLHIEVKTDPRRQINVLKISVKGLKPGQGVDFETYFFVEVDRLATLGPAGGSIQSPSGQLLLNVPRGAVSSTTTVALTSVRGFKESISTYQMAPAGLNLNQPATVTMRYDPTSLPPGVMEDDLVLLSGKALLRKIGDPIVDKTTHAVSGTITSFSEVFISYYLRIGKKLTDIPQATDFRLPIGDHSDASYTCGQDYQPPSEKDFGEILTLLGRSSHPNFDYPEITFNRAETGDAWHVVAAYGRNRYVNSPSGPTADSRSLYGEDERIFSNGEDWQFLGPRHDHGSLPVRAMADGLVIYNGRGYGNTVVLAHQITGTPILSIYSNLAEKSLCAVGTVVHMGNVIGKLGPDGGGYAHLHFAIGKQSLMRLHTETGEIKAPAVWFGEWTQDSVYENYYDPTNFLLNMMGKYKWDFEVNGNSEGWIAMNAKQYGNGHMYQVKNGILSVKPISSHCQIESYPLRLEAEFFDSLFVRMKSNALGGYGKVFFAIHEDPEYSEEKHVAFEVKHDQEFYDYRIVIADNPHWKGTIIGIRIDLLDTTGEEITGIGFGSSMVGRAYLSRTPDTGQTKCYDNSQEITCPGPNEPFHGQDAHYADSAPSYEVKTIRGDEIVLDHVTGLAWQRHDDGIKRTYREAMDYCENLTLAAYSDWRLPSKKELQRIVDYAEFGPALDTAHFPYSYGPGDCYWSASASASLALSAWNVCLWDNQSMMNAKSNRHYIRAVRGRRLEFGHFKDNGDGTITDITTGLMWQQIETKAITWEQALAYCQNLNLAGHRDWRLPNIRELLSLVDDTRHGPSIDISYFPGCRPAVYWSSTTHTLYPSFAWYVGFNDGQAHGGGHKRRRYHVRAVRGGASSNFQ